MIKQRGKTMNWLLWCVNETFIKHEKRCRTGAKPSVYTSSFQNLIIEP